MTQKTKLLGFRFHNDTTATTHASARGDTTSALHSFGRWNVNFIIECHRESLTFIFEACFDFNGFMTFGLRRGSLPARRTADKASDLRRTTTIDCETTTTSTN